MIKRLTIRLRLIACMAFLGILLVVIGGVGINGIRTVNAALQDVYQKQMASALKLAEAKNFLNRSRFVIDRGVFHPEAPDLEKTLGRADGFIKDADKSWREYLAMPMDDDERALTADLDAKRTAYIDNGLRGLMDAIRSKDTARIDELAMKKLTPMFSTFDAASNKLEQYQMKSAAEHFAESQSFYDGVLKGFTAAIAIGLIVIVGATIVLLRAIMNPLDEALGHFDAIAAGNLADRIAVTSHDEMGNLLAGLSKMQQQLAATVQSVRHGSSAIAVASHEISAGNADLSRRTEQQAASLEETASSLEELTSTVRQNADNARQANQLALTASSVAGKGGQLVSQVVDTMDTINTSSKRIVDIIAVIDGIAFQTNILALNAAVEAARAGEQGRGFAVVASEVRNLAQRSAAAAKEIKELITASVNQVEAGTQLVGKAGSTMDEIVTSVEKVTTIMSDIMLAGEEQSAGIDQINQAIAQMDEATQQNAALVEEAAAAAESMRQQAAQLEELVSTFRLEGAPSSGRSSNRALALY
ncbi:methyl-accepting chemotaxis sensory transducer with TarH sensor [Pseudoduganella flava]|uniref:HAMP domain-containing protein n=1 Tax=Pseudoduganella flava TaxID=871742 RepID=A0A562PJX6_9BURK|nr:methyl-accepting chemotaxis protein [Pseudoduganella flava]QGZ41918.1 HAMP domain-containing protein [Pseudoduganella flava]TWI44326.1 methyl-accepting chemotaxis sensory transducer with TarH sensor [Pseudoduganella flava]